MTLVKVGDILEFQYYSTDSSIFVASGWFINDDLTMDGFPETKLQLLEKNMCKFKVGDTVKLISKNNNTALQIEDIGTITKIDTDGTCRVNTDKISFGNWTKLSDLYLVKRENKMNEINIEVPEGFVIDEENSSFTCIKFKKKEKKEVTCWEDLEKVKGYMVSDESVVYGYNNDGLSTETENRNTFATKEQAEACIALAMLSQLMKDVNGDWVPDWSDDNRKFIIRFFRNKLESDNFCSCQYFLSFPTKEIRDTFLKNHEELIMKAKPLL